MIVQIEITVPAGTSVNEPIIEKLSLCKGTLTRFIVRPPPGPNWEVYTRLLHFENSVVPNDNDEWIPLERETLEFTPNFNDWKDVYELSIEVCSPQAKYRHIIQYELEVNELGTTGELINDLIQRGM